MNSVLSSASLPSYHVVSWGQIRTKDGRFGPRVHFVLDPANRAVAAHATRQQAEAHATQPDAFEKNCFGTRHKAVRP